MVGIPIEGRVILVRPPVFSADMVQLGDFRSWILLIINYLDRTYRWHGFCCFHRSARH